MPTAPIDIDPGNTAAVVAVAVVVAAAGIGVVGIGVVIAAMAGTMGVAGSGVAAATATVVGVDGAGGGCGVGGGGGVLGLVGTTVAGDAGVGTGVGAVGWCCNANSSNDLALLGSTCTACSLKLSGTALILNHPSHYDRASEYCGQPAAHRSTMGLAQCRAYWIG
jgi:hypothetical protein